MSRSYTVLLCAGALLPLGCGNSGDDFEKDNSLDESSEITVGEVQERSIHVSDDVDYVHFTVEANQAYVAYTSFNEPEMDTVLTLLNANGDIVAENDDYSTDDVSSAESRLFFTISEAAEYYLLVSGYSGAIGDYSLSLELNALYDSMEPDNSMDTAGSIVADEEQTRSLHQVDDVDYIAFSASAMGVYQVTTTIPSGDSTDTSLSVISSDGVQLSMNDNTNSSTLGSQVLFVTPLEGTYYFVVSGRAAGSYLLTVTDLSDSVSEIADQITALIDQLQSAGADLYEPDNSIGDASSIRLGEAQQRTITAMGSDVDVDYVLFEATSGGNYAISTTPVPQSNTDLTIIVRNTVGDILDVIDTGKGGQKDEANFVAPQDGIYYLQITAYNSDSAGAYTLLVNESL